jgi:hypothetical protein
MEAWGAIFLYLSYASEMTKVKLKIWGLRQMGGLEV